MLSVMEVLWKYLYVFYYFIRSEIIKYIFEIKFS